MIFRLRLATDNDLIETGQLLFEVVHGDTTHVFKAHPLDVAALNSVSFQYNSGLPMPIEAGVNDG